MIFLSLLVLASACGPGLSDEFTGSGGRKWYDPTSSSGGPSDRRDAGGPNTRQRGPFRPDRPSSSGGHTHTPPPAAGHAHAPQGGGGQDDLCYNFRSDFEDQCRVPRIKQEFVEFCGDFAFICGSKLGPTRIVAYDHRKHTIKDERLCLDLETVFTRNCRDPFLVDYRQHKSWCQTFIKECTTETFSVPSYGPGAKAEFCGTQRTYYSALCTGRTIKASDVGFCSQYIETCAHDPLATVDRK